MVEYYCMLAQRISGVCTLLLAFSTISFVILFIENNFEKSDIGKYVLIILAVIVFLSTVTLTFIPDPDVLRAMMSE